MSLVEEYAGAEMPMVLVIIKCILRGLKLEMLRGIKGIILTAGNILCLSLPCTKENLQIQTVDGWRKTNCADVGISEGNWLLGDADDRITVGALRDVIAYRKCKMFRYKITGIIENSNITHD